MNGWESFLVAEVGASAVLIGLIFVGVSINLSKIVSFPRLPSRALEALLLLLTAMIISSVLLVPGQSLSLVGSEVLVIGLCAWIGIILADIGVWRNTEVRYRQVVPFLIVMNQLSILPYLITGLMVLLHGSSGLYWLVPAILISFVKAMIDAWVLLVEINR